MKKFFYFWSFAFCCMASFAGCTSYTVLKLHDNIKTPYNHYIVLKSANGGLKYIFDCYSKPDGTNWAPVCKEIKEEKCKHPDKCI